MGGLVVAVHTAVIRGGVGDGAEEVHGQPYLHNILAWFLWLLSYSCSEDTFGVTFAVDWQCAQSER